MKTNFRRVRHFRRASLALSKAIVTKVTIVTSAEKGKMGEKSFAKEKTARPWDMEIVSIVSNASMFVPRASIFAMALNWNV